MSLTYIGQQITIYVGFCLLIVGVSGNALNVWVFSGVHFYRANPCTFYFLTGSIYNIAYIIVNLIPRIVSAGYGIDLTQTSTSWCKARNFFLYTLSMNTLTCACLAVIDQFLVTSRNAKLRSLSNIKWAHILVFILSIIWFLHGIPSALYYNISSVTRTCTITNNIFVTYRSIFLLGLLTNIPVTIVTLFGFLTYRNIHLTRFLAEQQVDQQIVRMTLIQVLLVFGCIIPYTIVVTYNYITANDIKDANRLILENFILTLVALLNYGYYVGSCGMFYISSRRFRRAIKDRLLFWRRPNQINILTQPVCERMATQNGSMTHGPRTIAPQ